MGVYMVSLPFQQLLLKFVLYQLHKTIGITVLLLVLTQLTFHFRRGRPAPGDDVPGWQQRAAPRVHAALFVLMVATPCLGYLTAATAPVAIPTLFLGVIPVPHVVGTDPAWFQVLRQVHMASAMALLVLVCGHAGAALHHHWNGHDTLVGMLRGRRTSPSRMKYDTIPNR